MLFKCILFVSFFVYATSRTAKNFRQMPEAALRLSQADYPYYNIIAPNGPGTYAFGYEVNDPATGNIQFRDEEKLSNGSVVGSYGYLTPDNTLHVTKYIADIYGYRTKTETRKKTDGGPLKIELQLQPTAPSRPAVTSPTNPPQYPFAHPSTTSTIPNDLETIKPTIDPLVASQIYQQHQINLQPTYNPLRDQNVLDPYMANAFLNQQYYVASQDPYIGLRQNYGGPVSTYQSNQQPTNGFPFFNWFGSNGNGVYQDQAQPPRPILDFITNIANDNPITSFWNTFNQNLQNNQNQYNNQRPFQAFLSAINPLNAFLTNNNNNNNNINSINKPATTSLPVTQGDYIQPIPPANNLDSSVFSNDHFLNPNAIYQNQVPNVMHNYYPNSNGNTNQHYNQPISYIQPYSQLHNANRYPYYYNPYQTIAPLSITPSYNNRKKVGSKSKRKKNKNKVDVPESDSDWFQGFLDKRKEASLDTISRHSLKDSDEDDDDDFGDYFR